MVVSVVQLVLSKPCVFGCNEYFVVSCWALSLFVLHSHLQLLFVLHLCANSIFCSCSDVWHPSHKTCNPYLSFFVCASLMFFFQFPFVCSVLVLTPSLSLMYARRPYPCICLCTHAHNRASLWIIMHSLSSLSCVVSLFFFPTTACKLCSRSQDTANTSEHPPRLWVW